MKKELGFIDRMVSWCVHKLSGVELDRKEIRPKQISTEKANC